LVLRLLAIGGLVVAVAAAGAAGASARRDSDKKSVSSKTVLLDAVSAHLGIGRKELRRARRDGKTIAELARAHGTSLKDLQELLVKATAAWLAGRVKNGEITKARSRELLAGARPQIAAFIRRDAGTKAGEGGKRSSTGDALTTAAARFLHLGREELVAKLRSGRTLAGLVAVRKLSVDELKSAMHAAVETKLTLRVQAGTLTEARKRKLLVRADRRIDRLVGRATV
jgi:hypothetical protein